MPDQLNVLLCHLMFPAAGFPVSTNNLHPASACCHHVLPVSYRRKLMPKSALQCRPEAYKVDHVLKAGSKAPEAGTQSVEELMEMIPALKLPEKDATLDRWVAWTPHLSPCPTTPHSVLLRRQHLPQPSSCY